jgi:hypothetical protein
MVRSVGGSVKVSGLHIRLGQFGLKVETADPRQPDIKDQAARNIGSSAGLPSTGDPQVAGSLQTPSHRVGMWRLADSQLELP